MSGLRRDRASRRHLDGRRHRDPVREVRHAFPAWLSQVPVLRRTGVGVEATADDPTPAGNPVVRRGASSSRAVSALRRRCAGIAGRRRRGCSRPGGLRVALLVRVAEAALTTGSQAHTHDGQDAASSHARVPPCRCSCPASATLAGCLFRPPDRAAGHRAFPHGEPRRRQPCHAPPRPAPGPQHAAPPARRGRAPITGGLDAQHVAHRCSGGGRTRSSGPLAGPGMDDRRPCAGNPLRGRCRRDPPTPSEVGSCPHRSRA